MADAVVVVEEPAAHGMPLVIWVISPAICGSILTRHASPEMKQRWLPPIADGSAKMAFALTEPDAGSNGPGEAANIAKYAASEAALSALDQAIQTPGGNGLSHEYGLFELWFVTRLMRTAPVSREMVLNFIAQTSLGLPRSY